MISILVLVLAAVVLLFQFFVWKTNVEGRLDLRKKHVLVTGGSGGIGRAVAEECLRRGARVTITARSRPKLESVAAQLRDKFEDSREKVFFATIDVQSPQNVIDNAMGEVTIAMGPVDVLVNCAGTSVNGTFAETSDEDFTKLYDLNVVGTVRMIKAVLPLMQRRRTGQILLIASVSGQFGFYGYSCYSASKFALSGLAQSLAMELKPYNIGITIVYPPDTETEGYGIENCTKPAVTNYISSQGGLYQPSYVAQKIVKAIANRKYSLSFGLEGFSIEMLALGCHPPSDFFSIIYHFLLSGITRIVFLVNLSNFYDHTVNNFADSDKTD